MKGKITITIAMIAMIAAVGTMTTTQIQQAFGDRQALRDNGDSLCPPGHECHCTAASGVYHDYDPETEEYLISTLAERQMTGNSLS